MVVNMKLKIQKNKTQIKNLESVIIIFFLVYFNLSSLAVNVRMENSNYAIASLGIFIFLFLIKVFKKDVININIKLLLLTIIAILIIFLNVLITGDKNILNYVIISQIISAFIVVSILNFEDFVDSFTKVMLFFSVYSLIITYLISPFFPAISSIFPIRFNSTGEMLRDYIFAFKFIGSYTLEIRNTGIFREMGVYSTYLNLALTFYLFMRFQNKKSNWVIVVFVITILSTLSTAGILNLFLIMVAYIFFYSKKMEIRSIFISSVLAIIALTLTSSINSGFINQIENSVNKFENQGSSYQVRTAAIIGNTMAWSENPILGNGIDKGIERAYLLYLSKFSIHNTSTTTAFLAIYGIVFTLIMTMPILMFFLKKIKTNYIIKTFIIAGFFISINSQRLIYDQFMYVLYFSYFMRTKKLSYQEE